MIRVAVVDSFPMFLNGVSMTVEQQTDMQLVGATKCGSETLVLVREKSPDVIILGLNLDNGADEYEPVAVVSTLHQKYPNVRVIVHSNGIVPELVEAGVAGYILKHDSLSMALAEGIRVIHNGGHFYSEAIKKLLPLVE